MKFYSTKRQSPEVTFEEAIMQGLPTDNGLFMPEKINTLPASFFENIAQFSFPEMAFEVAKCLLYNEDIEHVALQKMITNALNFEAPLVALNPQKNLYCLELFHGPSLAFKDFGARFMAQVMGYFAAKVQKNEQESEKNRNFCILVATSGDTGGAVAQGFLGVAGTKVTVLYPSKKISELQEKQLTTLGKNITAVEVDGTFDDCQQLVKTAFLDPDLQQKLWLSSANSINLARLIPQMFYYFEAYRQLVIAQKIKYPNPVVFCTPSGNFGNLCAGLLAKRMGLPVQKFIAAVNQNDVFTKYLQNGVFVAQASVPTVANAMDVGNPSNLQRINELYDNDIQKIKTDICSYTFNNKEIIEKIKEIFITHNYLMCPHTAVAYLGAETYLNAQSLPNKAQTPIVFLSTAHPAKFLDVIEPALNIKIPLPPALQSLVNKTKVATFIPNNYTALKTFLLQNN